MELDPKYCDLIVQLWQIFSGGAATLDGDGRTYDDIAAKREAVAPAPVAVRDKQPQYGFRPGENI